MTNLLNNQIDAIDQIADQISGESDWEQLCKLVQELPEPIQSLVVVVVVRETPLANGGTVKDLLTREGLTALDARLAWALGKVSDTELEDARYAAWTAAQGTQWSATRDATRAAARAAEPANRAAARAAVWSAAQAAAWAVALEPARYAAQSAQAKIARRVLKDAVK